MAGYKKARVLRMLFCDFCGRSQDACVVLVRGRDDVHICDGCAPDVLMMVTDYIAALKPRVESPLTGDAVDPQVGTTTG